MPSLWTRRELGNNRQGWSTVVLSTNRDHAKNTQQRFKQPSLGRFLVKHMTENIMGNGRFLTIVDRMQELLKQDPKEFERVLDIIEEVV